MSEPTAQILEAFDAIEDYLGKGHPKMVGDCAMDHWPDRGCDCGYETSKAALATARAAYDDYLRFG